MSTDGSVTLVWGNGETKFRFAIGQFRELQERVNSRRISIGAPLVGPMAMLNLLGANDAWPDDVRDVLRIGLVGAGMPIAEANRLLVTHFDTRPLLESMRPAFTVLFAGLVGDPSDPSDASKKKPEMTTNSDPSSSASSTATALP